MQHLVLLKRENSMPNRLGGSSWTQDDEPLRLLYLRPMAIMAATPAPFRLRVPSRENFRRHFKNRIAGERFFLSHRFIYLICFSCCTDVV